MSNEFKTIKSYRVTELLELMDEYPKVMGLYNKR